MFRGKNDEQQGADAEVDAVTEKQRLCAVMQVVKMVVSAPSLPCLLLFRSVGVAPLQQLTLPAPAATLLKGLQVVQPCTPVLSPGQHRQMSPQLDTSSRFHLSRIDFCLFACFCVVWGHRVRSHCPKIQIHTHVW